MAYCSVWTTEIVHELWVHASIPPCPVHVFPFVAGETVRESLVSERGRERENHFKNGSDPVSNFPTGRDGNFSRLYTRERERYGIWKTTGRDGNSQVLHNHNGTGRNVFPSRPTLLFGNSRFQYKALFVWTKENIGYFSGHL